MALIANTFTQRGMPGGVPSSDRWRVPGPGVLSALCSDDGSIMGGLSFRVDCRQGLTVKLYHTLCLLSNTVCIHPAVMYNTTMPKLWNDTIEAHRREVRDAILNTAAALAIEHGLLSVTMSQIAEATGIGRATLYKYFSGVEEILAAWHERQVRGHFEQLVTLRHRAGAAGERLAAVLE